MTTSLLSNNKLIEGYFHLPLNRKRYFFNYKLRPETEDCYISKSLAASYKSERFYELYDLIWWSVNYNLLIKTFYCFTPDYYVFVHNYCWFKFQNYSTYKSRIYSEKLCSIIDFKELHCSDNFRLFFNQKSIAMINENADLLIDAFKEITENALMGALNYSDFLKRIINEPYFIEEFSNDTNKLSAMYLSVLKKKINEINI